MILITNADSFIGKNLSCFLEQMHFTVIALPKRCTHEQLLNALKHTDFIINLLGLDFVTHLIGIMQTYNLHNTLLTISDATHLNHKWDTESALLDYAKKSNSKAFIARLPIIFGKWGKPLVPSQLPQDKTLELMYIDDVVHTFVNVIQNANKRDSGYVVMKPIYTTTANELSNIFDTFSKSKTVPDLNNPFLYKLYATHLSYLDPKDTFDVFPKQPNTLDTNLIQSPHFGKISLLTLKPGDIYGEHWHHTKIEQYIVLSGKAYIILRSILEDVTYTHYISAVESITIPPAYTHQLANIGENPLIILLWSSDDTPDDTFLELV